MRLVIRGAFALLLSLLSAPATSLAQESQDPPAPPASWRDAFAEGRFWLSLRYRFENVDQDGFDKEANASTLLTVLGYETARYHGFAALLEFTDVSSIGDDDYNSTTNGMTDRPIVADPESAEINQVYADWLSDDELGIRAGRQRIELDNRRFIGNTPWRQNEQTFDALTITKDFGRVDAFYSYLANVNRNVGDESPDGDHRMSSHLFHLQHTAGLAGKLSAYAYLLDYDKVDTRSSNTFGARLVGHTELEQSVNWLWAGELATQSDAGDNPNDVSATYALLEIGATWKGATLKVGEELLHGSGDPGDSFQTPLAAAHGFNGWADTFLTTPDEGLGDVYVSLSGTLSKVDLTAAYHDFRSDAGSLDYGTEIDLRATYSIAENITAELKFADYDANDFATDTTKIWLWLTLRF